MDPTCLATCPATTAPARVQGSNQMAHGLTCLLLPLSAAIVLRADTFFMHGPLHDTPLPPGFNSSTGRRPRLWVLGATSINVQSPGPYGERALAVTCCQPHSHCHVLEWASINRTMRCAVPP
jgi:hypothetical protein